MNTVSARHVRRVVQRQGQALESLAPTLREMAVYAKGTRDRVEMLEGFRDMFRDMTLWDRVRWLIRGYGG